MNVLLLDTNIVSILFNSKHRLWSYCLGVVAEKQLAIALMTRAELLLWPTVNNWGEVRRSRLEQHLGAYTTLFPDEQTCEHWSRVVAGCRRAGRPIQTADAWIAATALQWQLPLVTADFGDYAAVEGLQIVPIRGQE